MTEVTGMNQNINDLIGRIKALEEELEEGFAKRREEFRFVIENKRIHFAEEMIELHKRFKMGVGRYLVGAHPLNILTAPVICVGFIPLLLLDLFVTIYQAVCFPVYGIPKGAPQRLSDL
jgi:hypothetical protein